MHIITFTGCPLKSTACFSVLLLLFVCCKIYIPSTFMRVCALVSGNPDTECDASKMGKLMCKFSTNIHSTQTDFSVYFHSDKGHEGI